MLRFALSSLVIVFSAFAFAASSAPTLAKVGRVATRDEVELLNVTLHRTADDLRRWAYTEHRTFRDDKGKLKSDVVVRYDPSKPYPEQWTPLKIDGKEPSERERAKYRKRGEKGAPREHQLIAAKPGKGDDGPRRVSLGEVMDVNKSSIAAETATHLTFEIPILKIGNERFPPEKFQVLARVRKEGNQLENISVKLRDSFRAKLVIKVKSGEASIDFETVNPKYPPTMVRVVGDAVASVMFVNFGGALQLERTELKHVKPFDERFDVQIGTLKAIDF